VRGAVPGATPAVVTLAPAGRWSARADLIRTVDLADGSFEVKGVAPGEYRVWAWELSDESIAQSPEFRNLLESRASTIEMHAGETQSLALIPISAAEVAEAREKLR